MAPDPPARVRKDQFDAERQHFILACYVAYQRCLDVELAANSFKSTPGPSNRFVGLRAITRSSRN